MAPTSNFQRLIPSGRDNESRLELAYQRVLLNHEKNERLLLKRIEQLESNQKNLIIERNMLRTKLCKQSGEMADLNWRVTHYEIYSYRNNKRQCMIDRDSWALTSKKRVWDFLSSHGIPYKVHNNRGTRRDSLSMSETGSCVAPAAMQPGPSNPDRLMGGISGGYSTSSRPTQRDITDISSISKGHGNFGSKRRDSVQTIQTTEMADFANTGPDDQTGLLACALEIAREMSSYRCYIRSSLRDFFGKYEPHNGKIEINKNHEKMRILQSEIPRREDESTIGTLEIGVKAISLTRDQELAQSEAGNRQGAVSLEFEDMDSIARPPPHLVNMDAKVGLVRALETYGNMLGTFCRTCNSMQALVTDLKSISGLIKASQKENDKLRESLDKVVSSKEVISAAPEDLVILLNSILRYPQWHNEAALSIDDCVAYPGDNNLISGEIQNLRKELSDKECEKSKSSQALENLESQFEEVSRINEELSENCTYFEKMATTLKAKHDEELKSKQDIIENLELRCESISQTNEASNGRINALMEDLSTRKVEVEKLKAKVIDLEKRNCTLETDCSDMKTAIDKKDRTLYVLTAENMSVIGVSAEKEASLNRMLVEHKARIHEISTEKLKLENDHARCNITIEELGRTISRKDDVIDRLDEEKKKAYCDIDSLNLSLQQSTESWGKKLAESVKTITKLETESSKLREKVSDLTKVVEVTDAKIQDTTRAHETTLDRLSGTVMENQTLCKKIECLQNELATKSKDLLDSGHKTEVLNELVGKMGKSIADLRVKNKDLEDNLSTKIDSLQNELTIISKDLSDSEHKNKLLKAHNGEIERFVVDLQNKNKDLENNLLVKDQVVRDMEGRYTKLDRSLSLKSNEFKEVPYLLPCFSLLLF